MKLDRYDIAMVNGTCKELARPMLQQVHLRKGKLEVADGYLLIIRDADVTPEEKDIEVLIPASVLKTVQTEDRRQAILTVGIDELVVHHQDKLGKPIEYNPTLHFQPFKTAGKYPTIPALFPKDTTKTATIAIKVKLMKKVLSCLPDEGILRLGITTLEAPMEFQCSNMDRPIRGLIMPMFCDWTDFQWFREPEELPITPPPQK